MAKRLSVKEILEAAGRVGRPSPPTRPLPAAEAAAEAVPRKSREVAAACRRGGSRCSRSRRLRRRMFPRRRRWGGRSR